MIELRLREGNPSLREIADLSGVSHAHVGDVLKGRYFPKLDTLLAIACSMGGDEDAFTRWWQEAARRPAERVPHGPKIPLTERALLAAILEELRGLRADLARITRG